MQFGDDGTVFSVRSGPVFRAAWILEKPPSQETLQLRMRGTDKIPPALLNRLSNPEDLVFSDGITNPGTNFPAHSPSLKRVKLNSLRLDRIKIHSMVHPKKMKKYQEFEQLRPVLSGLFEVESN